MPTVLIVGLGNPGPEYVETRHNAGFLAVDELAGRLGASYWKDACGSKVAVVKRGDLELVLAKPQSFMNLSGGPVKRLLETYGLPVSALVVVHDELDIPSGEVRAKDGGGHAGHNGLRSLHDKLGTDAYARIRVGIGRPPGRMVVSDYVLQEPRGEAAELFRDSIPVAAQAALHVAEHGIRSAVAQYR